MSGSRVLVDTNVFIYLLSGDTTAARFLKGKEVFISFITEIELLSYKLHSIESKKTIQDLIDSTTIVHSNSVISGYAAEIKIQYRLILPDAIIASTADYIKAPLVSDDKSFLRIENIPVIQYIVKN